jgi:hypothetical protein
MKAFSYLGVALLLFTSRAGAADNKWTIHEWGTFTSLQNEAGETLGSINTDDEPVPKFVHRLGYDVLLQPGQMPAFFSKGSPSCHPDVTMRLETPVIYFHPPVGQTDIQNANVTVKFRGGWLTEFFPDANATAPGLIAPHNSSEPNFQQFLPTGHLRSETASKLEWNDLKIGGSGEMPATSDHVWTSPRAVQTAGVKAANGEYEKFLFYRGIAHINAPLKVSRDPNTGELLFRSQLADLSVNQPLPIRSMWLVDIRKDGKLAFRTLPSVSLDQNSKKILAHTPAEFEAKDFSSANLEKLKTSLQCALVADGLFTDEAQAMLNTWEVSYFKSAGLRVFFLVPHQWTDFYLPLDTSLPADINRVMVGRVELITHEQRETLAKIGTFSPSIIQSDARWMAADYQSTFPRSQGQWEALNSGKKALSSAISVPKTYQTYLDLGRFRNALILDEAKLRPTPGLTNFIATYRLQAYRPPETVAARIN